MACGGLVRERAKPKAVFLVINHITGLIWPKENGNRVSRTPEVFGGRHSVARACRTWSTREAPETAFLRKLPPSDPLRHQTITSIGGHCGKFLPRRHVRNSSRSRRPRSALAVLESRPPSLGLVLTPRRSSQLWEPFGT